MTELKKELDARNKILNIITEYYKMYHLNNSDMEGLIPYAKRVYDQEEMINLIDCALDFWLTAGRYTDQFECELARFLNVKYCSLVNSGSSANLLAFMVLTSPLLEERAIKPGDEVITVAAGFPTTVTPIIQYGAVPVFLDVTIPQYNINVNDLQEALTTKTKAIMLAHTMGNPFNLKAVKEFCVKNDLWLIEDNCDALGSRYLLDSEKKFTGTIGDIGTSSFYPPHHMTMGEGGAVYTNNPILHKIIRSMRDWGRDCICPSGKDNICGHRFDRQYGELPMGYDHKYVYSHFGYNLKATDMQAAIGVAQLKKLPFFIEKRKENFRKLRSALNDCQERLILPVSEEHSEPSWFGFLMTCKTGVKRNEVVRHLENNGIQTRMLFAGNLLKHPCFDEMRKKKSSYRIIGDLKNTDLIMNSTFWVGVYPGLTEQQLEKIVNEIKKAVSMC